LSCYCRYRSTPPRRLLEILAVLDSFPPIKARH
jgi:hypothetical protein